MSDLLVANIDKNVLKRLISNNHYSGTCSSIRLNTDGLDFVELEVSPPRGKHREDSLNLQNLFDRYYSARKAAGAAERTLDDYVKHIRWFRSFLDLQFSGLDNDVPNREVIRAWILHMMTMQKLKPATINIRLRTVKAMFNWAVKERILKESPFENVELLRVPEEFHVTTAGQECRLFGVCDLSSLTGIRDALLMSFLLDTGVRIGECMSILVTDVVTVRAETVKKR